MQSTKPYTSYLPKRTKLKKTIF